MINILIIFSFSFFNRVLHYVMHFKDYYINKINHIFYNAQKFAVLLQFQDQCVLDYDFMLDCTCDSVISHKRLQNAFHKLESLKKLIYLHKQQCYEC